MLNEIKYLNSIIGLAGIFSTRFVTLVLSTTEEDIVSGMDAIEQRIIEERLAIKRRIESEVNRLLETKLDVKLDITLNKYYDSEVN